MNTIFILISIILIAILFYIVIPAVEALRTRDKWKDFRLGLIRVSLFPLLGDTPAGDLFRFFGKIEALQGRNRIWVSNGKLTVAVDLKDVHIYIMPAFSFSGDEHNFVQYETVYRHIQPGIVKWEQLFSITEGTNIFVAGKLIQEDGKKIFKNTSGERLIVVINDGSPSTLLNRAIWCGRQKNEYWNQSTLVSLTSGVLALLTFSYFLFRSQFFRQEGIIALALSLLPVGIFFPPGVILFYFYRKLWKKARYYRANRDLLGLPLRYFEKGIPLNAKGFHKVSLPDGTPYILNIADAGVNFPLVTPSGELTIRDINGAGAQDITGTTYLFGRMEEDEKGMKILSSPDPMVETVLVPGHPKRLMRACDQKSTKDAVLSGLLLGLDVIITFGMLFIFFRYLLR